MSKWEEFNREELDWVEVKVKIPKKCLAFLITYIAKRDDGSMDFGDTKYDTEDIEKLMENEDVRNND